MLVFFILLLLLLPLRGGMDLPITPFLSIPILIYFEVMYLHLPRLEWKWKLLSCVQLFGTHGIFSPWNSPGQNTIMGTFPFSRGYSQPRDRTQVSRIAGGFFTNWATREAQEYWSRQLVPSPADLPNRGIEPGTPALQAGSLPADQSEKPSLEWLYLF